MNFILLVVTLIAISFLYIRYLEKTTLFYPDRTLEQDPASIGLAFEDLEISTANQHTLHGWWIPQKEVQKTILFLHGNAGNISHRLGKIAFFYEMGLSVMIFDYRGFGKSTGRPTEKGVYEDAQAAKDFLLKNKGVSSDDLIIYGLG